MPPALRRSMSLPHATAMVVGIILGASIFIQPSEITRLVPSVRGLMMVWLAAGALTACGALVCAELSSAFPHTGGVYVFLKEIFSPALGFLWGWGMFWSMHSGIIAAIAVILARYMAYFVPMGEHGVRVVAIAAILVLSGVNYLGVKPGSAVQVLLTAAKVGAVVVMVFLLFWFGGPAHHALPAETALAGPISFAAYGLAVAAGLFAFGGWHMVTYAAGETRDPERTIPRSLLLGTLVVTACYMLLNAAYLYVLPLSGVAHSTRVAADAIEHVLGTRFGTAIALVVVVSALGGVNGIILAGPRVYYAMAQDGLVFRSGGHQQLQPTCFSSHLHGMAVFCVAGRRAVCVAPAERIQTGILSPRLSVDTFVVHRGVTGDRGQPDPGQSAQQRHGIGLASFRSARVLCLVAKASKTADSKISDDKTKPSSGSPARMPIID